MNRMMYSPKCPAFLSKRKGKKWWIGTIYGKIRGFLVNLSGNMFRRQYFVCCIIFFVECDWINSRMAIVTPRRTRKVVRIDLKNQRELKCPFYLLTVLLIALPIIHAFLDYSAFPIITPTNDSMYYIIQRIPFSQVLLLETKWFANGIDSSFNRLQNCYFVDAHSFYVTTTAVCSDSLETFYTPNN